MMQTLWLTTLTILVFLQGRDIRKLGEEIEAIKSWYPFCEIMKMKIQKGDKHDRPYKQTGRD